MQIKRSTPSEVTIALLRCSKLFFPVLLVMLMLSGQAGYGQICSDRTPTFTFDFTGHPDTVFNTGDISRVGSCCGNNGTTCVHFDMTLDAKTLAVVVDITN